MASNVGSKVAVSAVGMFVVIIFAQMLSDVIADTTWADSTTSNIVGYVVPLLVGLAIAYVATDLL